MQGGVWLGSNGEESLEPGPGGLGVGLSPPWEKAQPFNHLLLLFLVSFHFLYRGPNIATVNITP